MAKCDRFSQCNQKQQHKQDQIAESSAEEAGRMGCQYPTARHQSTDDSKCDRTNRVASRTINSSGEEELSLEAMLEDLQLQHEYRQQRQQRQLGGSSNGNNAASSSNNCNDFTQESNSSFSYKWEDSVTSFNTLRFHGSEIGSPLVAGGAGAASPKRKHRSVQFADVEVREYGLTVGDHARLSCPLSLSWEYAPAVRQDLESYERKQQAQNNNSTKNATTTTAAATTTTTGSTTSRLTLPERRRRLVAVLGNLELAQVIEVAAARQRLYEEMSELLTFFAEPFAEQQQDHTDEEGEPNDFAASFPAILRHELEEEDDEGEHDHSESTTSADYSEDSEDNDDEAEDEDEEESFDSDMTVAMIQDILRTRQSSPPP